MTRFPLLALLYPVILCTGCATDSYSDKRLKIDTGELLGVDPSLIEISDEHVTNSNTYYTAKINSAEYSCTIAGGSVMESVIKMGISPVPRCVKKDEPPSN